MVDTCWHFRKRVYEFSVNKDNMLGRYISALHQAVYQDCVSSLYMETAGDLDSVNKIKEMLEMPKLNEIERDTFLSTREVLMRIACVREDGSPLVTPIWFIHQDDAIYFTPREMSEWFTCLKSDPRVCLCIDEDALPYRKLVVEGEAELIHDVGNDDVWRDLYRSIAQRYIPLEEAEAYVENTIDQPRALYRVTLSSAKVKTWRMPMPDEDQTGIWHSRYYKKGSKFGDATGV